MLHNQLKLKNPKNLKKKTMNEIRLLKMRLLVKNDKHLKQILNLNEQTKKSKLKIMILQLLNNQQLQQKLMLKI
jgi:hypothetical protein